MSAPALAMLVATGLAVGVLIGTGLETWRKPPRPKPSKLWVYFKIRGIENGFALVETSSRDSRKGWHDDKPSAWLKVGEQDSLGTSFSVFHDDDAYLFERDETQPFPPPRADSVAASNSDATDE